MAVNYPFTREGALGYLAALIDGEGTVQCVRRNRNIAIANTDLGILAAGCACCDLLGIEWRLWEDRDARRKRPCWYLLIRKRESLAFIYEYVPLQSAVKRERLGQLLLTYKRPRSPSAETLRSLYWERNMTAREIADFLGFPSSTSGVYHQMKRHGIARRPASPRPANAR
jgi:hypothetical protein